MDKGNEGSRKTKPEMKIVALGLMRNAQAHTNGLCAYTHKTSTLHCLLRDSCNTTTTGLSRLRASSRLAKDGPAYVQCTSKSYVQCTPKEWLQTSSLNQGHARSFAFAYSRPVLISPFSAALTASKRLVSCSLSSPKPSTFATPFSPKTTFDAK